MSDRNYTAIRRIKDYNLANIMLNLLKSNDIEAVILSKKDSMYYMPHWGYYEILVPADDLESATLILQNFESSDGSQ